MTTSADDTAVDISGSLSGAAVKFDPIWHTMTETVTDKEGYTVEGKLEISSAVAEIMFKADAGATLQVDASDAANALVTTDGANTDTSNLPGHHTIIAAVSQGRGGKVAYDPSISAADEEASTQSTSAENGFSVSKPSETASGNKDHSAFQFKPSMDHHAVADPKINDTIKEHSEHPAHPHLDNVKFADNDDHPGMASHYDSKINDIAKEQPEHPAHPHSDSFKFAPPKTTDLTEEGEASIFKLEDGQYRLVARVQMEDWPKTFAKQTLGDMKAEISARSMTLGVNFE